MIDWSNVEWWKLFALIGGYVLILRGVRGLCRCFHDARLLLRRRSRNCCVPVVEHHHGVTEHRAIIRRRQLSEINAKATGWVVVEVARRPSAVHSEAMYVDRTWPMPTPW